MNMIEDLQSVFQHRERLHSALENLFFEDFEQLVGLSF